MDEMKFCIIIKIWLSNRLDEQVKWIGNKCKIENKIKYMGNLK